jgi:anaerobic C4-dicarboxylate transporter
MSLLILLAQIALCIWIGGAVIRLLGWMGIGIFTTAFWQKMKKADKTIERA